MYAPTNVDRKICNICYFEIFWSNITVAGSWELNLLMSPQLHCLCPTIVLFVDQKGQFCVLHIGTVDYYHYHCCIARVKDWVRITLGRNEVLSGYDFTVIIEWKCKYICRLSFLFVRTSFLVCESCILMYLSVILFGVGPVQSSSAYTIRRSRGSVRPVVAWFDVFLLQHYTSLVRNGK